jgi:hypothetical protein
VNVYESKCLSHANLVVLGNSVEGDVSTATVDAPMEVAPSRLPLLRP